ncbi:MAG: retroviral-like aspartic protease family protein [Candidatus Hydrogenedentota bacterium]
MGETYAEIKLIANKKEIKKRLLVDTGATFSWINSKTLKQLGIQPTDEEELETIEGTIIKRKIAEIEIECFGRKGHTGVIFAKRKDSEVLGVHALETLRLEIDPFRNRIKKSRAIKAL